MLPTTSIDIIYCLSAMYIMFGVLGVLANSFLIAAILKSKLQGNSAFVTTLAMSDTLFSFGFVYIGCMRVLSMRHLGLIDISEIACTAAMTPMLIGSCLQQYLLLAIAVERGFVILLPHLYHNYSRLYVKSAITVCLVVTVVTLGVSFINRSPTVTVSLCAGFITSYTAAFRLYLNICLHIGPYAIIALLSLFIIIYPHARTKFKATLLVDDEELNISSNRKTSSWERQISRSQATILAIYSLTAGLGFLFQYLAPRITSTELGQIAVIQVASILQGSSCCSNVVIYGLRIREVGKKMKSFLSGAEDSSVSVHLLDVALTNRSGLPTYGETKLNYPF